MNHDSSIRNFTGCKGKYRRIGSACAVFVVLAVMTAISMGSFEAPAAAPETAASVVNASAPAAIPDEEPVLASVGYPVECSQVPSRRDCLYY